MPLPPHRPRRTVAIIVLDKVIAVAGATRRAVTGAGDGSRMSRIVVVATLAVLITTAVVAVLAGRTPERPAPVAVDSPPDVEVWSTTEAGRPGRRARPAASRPTPEPPTTVVPAPRVPPSATGSSVTTQAPVRRVPLTAHFAVEESALLSYGAAVTISNPGPERVTAWELVVTLPRESLDVTAVTGARATRAGATWTFVPDGTAGQVPAAGSVRVTFRVRGAQISSTPVACAVDATACTGLSD
ncbi:cellulose-binding domain-containing protein [Micromonospora phytophila]|uniref:cellulose binding domain-containing protein n=1 Tax=Micromonospora phytophila TaxID=709888 RepID=UPI00202FE7C2|nr:cellulose binding domain-containing protein [Micromonospora phytophila]MCM0676044.1 cellulose-binding domain-containing protein [Micromonospora phytophila]